MSPGWDYIIKAEDRKKENIEKRKNMSKCKRKKQTQEKKQRNRWEKDTEKKNLAVILSFDVLKMN